MPGLKICGVTNAAFALEAVRRGADCIGFVFVEGSPRCVSAETARDIVSAVKGARFVGVFSGQGVLKILAIAELVGLDIVQLHGGYSADDVAALKSRGYEVWRLDSGDGFAGEDAAFEVEKSIVQGEFGRLIGEVRGELFEQETADLRVGRELFAVLRFGVERERFRLAGHAVELGEELTAFELGRNIPETVGQ